MKLFLLGFFAALVLIAVAGYAYIAFGLAPVATAAPPLPLEKLITGIALRARIKKEAPTSAPIQPSEEVYRAGALIYREDCAVCHGLPGQEQSAIGRGEFPIPPELFNDMGVTDDAPGITFWKIAHGIRLTGMPSFEKTLSSDQIWQVTLLLANADKLPASVRTILQAPLPK